MGHRIAGILFDIGGVLVALDGVPSMAKLLGVEPQHEALHAMWIASPSVVQHETGKIDAAAFAAGVVTDLGLPVTADCNQIGCLKPDTRAFEVALEGMGLLPSDVLFLDDGLRNIDAALKLGMHAHLARGPGEARRVLARYGVVPSGAGT